MEKSIKELRPGETCWVERGIYAYRTGKGIRYGISFMDGDKRRMKIVGDKLTDARRELEAKRTDVRRGDYKHVDRRAMPTFEQYAQAYVEHGRKIGKRSVDRDELALRAARVVFGSKRMNALTRKDTTDFMEARRDGRCGADMKRQNVSGISDRTVNRDLQVVKHVLRVAVDEKITTRTRPGP